MSYRMSISVSWEGMGGSSPELLSPFCALRKSIRKEPINLQLFGEGEEAEGVLQGLSPPVGRLGALFKLHLSSICPHPPDHTMGFVDMSCALAARCRPETAPREVRIPRC